MIFNVNYIRPRVYAREALAEIEAYLTRFPSRFFDEYSGEVGTFDSDHFLTVWDKTNAWGVRDHVEPKSINDTNFFTPRSIVESVWRWNFLRAETQASVGDTMFLPKLQWFRDSALGQVVPTIFWTDLIPIAFPELAAKIVVVRTRLSARTKLLSLFGAEVVPEYRYRVVAARGVFDAPDLERDEVAGMSCVVFRGGKPSAILEPVFDPGVVTETAPIQWVSSSAVFEDDLRGG